MQNTEPVMYQAANLFSQNGRLFLTEPTPQLFRRRSAARSTCAEAATTGSVAQARPLTVYFRTDLVGTLKTKKGRNRFHTDWKEPKLLILYVVGDDGRPSQTWAPIIDGTLRGPEAVFALLLSYARQIGLNAADKVLFIADGAPWIRRRLQRLIAALGLSPTQVLGLIDFYHAAKQLSDAVKLRRWSATQRTRWLNRTPSEHGWTR